MNNLFIVGPMISQHIQSWYEGWENEAKLHIFTIHPGGRKPPDYAVIHNVKITGTRLDFLLLIPIFLYHWYKLKPKITNFHYLSSYGLLALFLPKNGLILNTWGSDVNLPYKSKSYIRRWFINKALNKFIWINAPAKHIKEKLIRLGADENIIDVFQYGINVGIPSQSLNKRKNERIVFISNRNWQPVYNISKIIKEFLSWQKISKYDAELWIYGRGNEREKRDIMDSLIVYNVLLQSKIIFKGYTEKQNMLNEITNANIYISIPKRDGTPLSLLEAMNLGLYPIVSDIDANHEWLTEKSAIFVDINKRNSLQNAFEKAIENYYQSNWQTTNHSMIYKYANANINVPRFQEMIIKLIKQN
ncbi:hypothetical protein C6H65_00730 [Photorhabdus luminescens]|nr:hypothetical protein C6H65_00730 [Photorhabdus luminescens]